MDPIYKGLIVGGASLFVLLAATFALGGILERGATDSVDETYSPASETTADPLGWPTMESTQDGDDVEPGSRSNRPSGAVPSDQPPYR